MLRQVRQQSQQHASQTYEVGLKIYDAEERLRERYFTNRKRVYDSGDETRSLIKFFRPSDIKGAGLLSFSNDAEDSIAQWMYFPAFKRIRKLSGQDRNGSFMGSDFTHADIAGRPLGWDDNRLTKEDADHYWVVSTPKNPQDLYSRIEYRIDRRTLVPERVVFYNRAGARLKTLTNREVVERRGMYLVVDAVMHNHISNGRTEVRVYDIDLDTRVSSMDVSTRSLRN